MATITMSRLVAVAAAAAGALAVRHLERLRSDDRSEAPRWLVVTVNRDPDEVYIDDALPEPPARLGDLIEVTVRPAPGAKAVELAARLRAPVPAEATGVASRVLGTDPRRRGPTVLREARSLLEAGEVTEPDQPGTTHPGRGTVIQMAGHRAMREGRL
ncbi:hypothetical protein [Pseudonocardia sp.]|jgi:hypothetical protein|uniref:hypothetical protein n=1 Tax=Pseudonocardia sp. TaxID=60912 RepID=UPI002608C9F2|nr:hypothetical protein [Pseudonocardia sp.]MCW2721091.1 hypothetical protein [Pseudonocardia sp.]